MWLISLLTATSAIAGELEQFLGFPFDDERVLRSSSGPAPLLSESPVESFRRLLPLASLNDRGRVAALVSKTWSRATDDRPAGQARDVDLDSSAGEFLAGAAAVDLTPRGRWLGCPLGGTGSRHKKLPLSSDPRWMDPSDLAKWQFPSLGVHDAVRAKALALSDGSRSALILSLDTVGVSESFVRELSRRLAGLGLDRSSIVVTATHNHSGPGALADEPWYWFTATDFYSPELFEWAIGRVVEAAREALSRLEPARIAVGTCRDSAGLSRNLRNHPELVDPEIGVVGVETRAGAPLALLFNFAMHANAIREGMVSPFFSADISGAAERAAENELEGLGLGRPVAMHINGAEGDVDPMARGYEAMLRDGALLARQALDCAGALPRQDALRLSIRNAPLRYPTAPYLRPSLVSPKFSRNLTLPLGALVTHEGWLQAISLNGAAIATVPGEPIAEIGHHLKAELRRLGHPHAWVFGLTGGYMAYVTTEAEYWKGGYQAAATLFGPGQAAWLEARLGELMLRLPAAKQ